LLAAGGQILYGVLVGARSEDNYAPGACCGIMNRGCRFDWAAAEAKLVIATPLLPLDQIPRFRAVTTSRKSIPQNVITPSPFPKKARDGVM